MVRKRDFKYVVGKKYDGMMGRCYRKSDRSYKNYGEKGIRVCAAWIGSVELFRVWIQDQLKVMGVSEEEFTVKSKEIQLDRKDPNGHYTAENCRLVSAQKNSRNKRNRLKNEYMSAEGILVTI